jgi:hypothetical protein
MGEIAIGLTKSLEARRSKCHFSQQISDSQTDGHEQLVMNNCSFEIREFGGKK